MTPTRSIDTLLPWASFGSCRPINRRMATGPAQVRWAGPVLSTSRAQAAQKVLSTARPQWLRLSVPPHLAADTARLSGFGYRFHLTSQLTLLGSVELTLFGRAGQRGRRRRRVDGGRDPVEVTGTDLALVLGRGVTALLGRELALLQLDVCAHLVTCIAVGQIEHRVVQRVEAGQRDELELEAHRAELLLEPCDRRVVQVLAPVERRGAVVGEALVGD